MEIDANVAHVLPRYSAIDMSTFEALKLAYLRSTGKDEPGVLALLAFGSISGSVGATMVYPLNLVRTRLQASGSTGHPERYSGISDVVRKTYSRDGWRGFYRGLVPTLAKVASSAPLSLPPCYSSPPIECRSFLPFPFPTWCTNRANESGCPSKSFVNSFERHPTGWVYSQNYLTSSILAFIDITRHSTGLILVYDYLFTSRPGCIALALYISHPTSIYCRLPQLPPRDYASTRDHDTDILRPLVHHGVSSQTSTTFLLL